MTNRIISTRITVALDRSLDVLGELGKQAIIDELISNGVISDRDDESAVAKVEAFLMEKFERGAFYLISRFRAELANRKN